jgi:predicted nuclease of restriction endonuclease-like RecB superfamily
MMTRRRHQVGLNQHKKIQIGAIFFANSVLEAGTNDCSKSLWRDSQDNLSLLLFPEISPVALAMEMGRKADVI